MTRDIILNELWDDTGNFVDDNTLSVYVPVSYTHLGNLVTRDLLYDAATNKQFITVETSGGNTFYLSLIHISSF